MLYYLDMWMILEYQVEEWDNMLNSISNIIEEWLLMQKQWAYLENIFSAEDTKKII